MNERVSRLVNRIRCFAVYLSMSVGAAGCGGPIVHPAPDEGGALPYGVVPTPSNESAAQASALCDLSFASLPTVNPDDVPETTCRCTRRSGSQEGEVGCIRGADWGVSATVGPAGGDILLRHTPFLESSGSGVLLHVPPNALAEPTTIRIVETSVPPPAGYADGAPIYVFEPVGLTFATPASIKIPWVLPPSGSSPPMMYWSSEVDPCVLEPLADSFTNAGFNQGTVARLGWAAVGLPLPQATPACP
jgi:hypothetical protein